MAKAKKSKSKKAAPKKTKAKKTAHFDFSDMDSVKEAMAEALGCEIDEIEIEESRGLGSFGAGTVYEVKCGHEYEVAENSDAAEELAIAVVTQDLESEPEIFNSDFIERHIDLDRLRNDLSSDVQNMRYDDLKEEAEKRPLKFIDDNNLDCPEPTKEQLRKHADAMGDDPEHSEKLYKELLDMSPEDQWSELGEEPEVKDHDIEEIAEQETEAQLKDPVEYLTEMYGKEDGVKKAIEIGGIDIEAAAKAAVDEDGAEHFIARYDGNFHNGPGGIVYWRSN